MRNNKLKELQLPSLHSNLYCDWEQTEQQPVSLKQLSNNLNLLEQQFYRNHQSNPSEERQRPKVRSVPLRKEQKNQENQLPRIFTSKEAIDLSSKKKKSVCDVSSMHTFLNKQTEISSIPKQKKKHCKNFSELKGQLPIESQEQNVFLHKHRMMNISRALNLNRIRNKTTHRTLALVQSFQHNQNEVVQLSAIAPCVQRLL